jgi:hypothetical protein
MSEPRLPHDLRIGRFLLDDILRYIQGCGQWFLFNITQETQLPATWLADLLCHLHTADIVQPECLRDGSLLYEEELSITRENLRAPLSRGQVEPLLAKVFAKAAEMNQSRNDQYEGYTILRIYLYGSCLRGAESPRDIDLGIEIQRKDGTPVPVPDSDPFGPPPEFAQAARPLALRKPRLISLHHIEKVRAIGAPNQLVWEAGRGRLKDKPLQIPQKTSATCPELAEREQRLARRQRELDAFVHRLRQIKDWPVMPEIAPTTTQPVLLKQYQEWQQNTILLTRAHLHCLPDGSLKKTIQHQMDIRLSASAELRQKWDAVAPNTLPFIYASQYYSPWHLRSDGRFVKHIPRR